MTAGGLREKLEGVQDWMPVYIAESDREGDDVPVCGMDIGMPCLQMYEGIVISERPMRLLITK